MRKIALTQTATGTWAASSVIRTSLEREGVITRIEANMEITPSATIAGAVQTQGLYRVAQNLRILAGGHTFMELPSTGESGHGSTLLHYVNNEDFGGMPGFPDQQTISAPDRTFHPVTFVLHCGSRPRLNGLDNPFDLSGCIPAFKVQDLIAEWTTGLNSVMDDTVTISSGVVRYTIYFVVGTHEEIAAEMVRQQVHLPQELRGATAMIPAWVGEVFGLDTTYTDFSYNRNIPTSRYMKRISILSQDATGTRALLANDEVTGVKVSVKLQDVLKVFGQSLSSKMKKANFTVADDAVELGAGGHAKGILIADLRPFGHPDYGLNFLTGEAAQVGAPKLGLTVTTNASGDDALFLYEGYVPYYDKLGY